MLRPYNIQVVAVMAYKIRAIAFLLDVAHCSSPYCVLSEPCSYQSACSDHSAQFKHAVQRH